MSNKSIAAPQSLFQILLIYSFIIFTIYFLLFIISIFLHIYKYTNQLLTCLHQEYTSLLTPYSLFFTPIHSSSSFVYSSPFLFKSGVMYSSSNYFVIYISLSSSDGSMMWLCFTSLKYARSFSSFYNGIWFNNFFASLYSLHIFELAHNLISLWYNYIAFYIRPYFTQYLAIPFNKLYCYL